MSWKKAVLSNYCNFKLVSEFRLPPSFVSYRIPSFQQLLSRPRTTQHTVTCGRPPDPSTNKRWRPLARWQGLGGVCKGHARTFDVSAQLYRAPWALPGPRPSASEGPRHMLSRMLLIPMATTYIRQRLGKHRRTLSTLCTLASWREELSARRIGPWRRGRGAQCADRPMMAREAPTRER